jgi:hypothetical protein
MVNSGEVPLKAVMFNKPKVLSGLDQNGMWPGAGTQRFLAADDVPPAERHDLTRSGTGVERGKPVALPFGEGKSQDDLTGLRAEDEGASECRPVMGRIGIASTDYIIPRRKPADFPRVFPHERTLAN